MQMSFALPALEYAPDALLPYIDAPTLALHHGTHFAGHVRALNSLLQPLPRRRQTLPQLILDACAPLSIQSDAARQTSLPPHTRAQVLEHAGAALNHALYFQGLCPPGGALPGPTLAAAIERHFGSASELQAALLRAAGRRVGSGWLWLAVDDQGALIVLTTANQDTLLPLGLWPLLCCDLWEHAYAAQYQNDREQAVEAWWRVVDWPQAQRRYQACGKTTFACHPPCTAQATR